MKKYKLQVFIFWFAFTVFVTCLYGVFYLASIGKLGDIPDFRQLENPKTNFASEIISSDKGLVKWLEILHYDGIAIVKNTPVII